MAKSIQVLACLRCEAVGRNVCDAGHLPHVSIVQLVPIANNYCTLVALGSDGKLYHSDVTVSTSVVEGYLGTHRSPWRELEAKERNDE